MYINKSSNEKRPTTSKKENKNIKVHEINQNENLISRLFCRANTENELTKE